MDILVSDGGVDAREPDALIVVDASVDDSSNKVYSSSLMSDLLKVSKDKAAEVKSMFAHMKDTTSVSAFSGGHASSMIHVGADKVVSVSLCLTPNTVSRHNCHTRPDAVSKLVKGPMYQARASSTGDHGGGHASKRARATTHVTVLVLLSDDPDHAPASQCLSVAMAIARAAPTYTRKGGASGEPSDMPKSKCVTMCFAVNGTMYTNMDVLNRIQATVNAVRNAGRLVDMPCNELTTTEFAKIAERVAADFPESVTHEAIVGEDLKAAGLGGIYGVGQAAVEPPRLVILRYKPPNAGPESVCWAGKGIVYDTGGLSIKTKTGMPGMKRDMGGAAAVLTAFAAAVETKAPVEITAVLCLAENAVGPLATRPDDIHTLYSGKTVEINNTDAEGRLVLGDGVAYATEKFNPSVIVDICTLTGAQGVATGKHFAAVMSSSEELERRAILAGRACGDLCHAVPYAPELFSNEFKSEVADMKNSVANRGNAQVSCAGQFIGNHINWDTYKGEWLHIDMAAPASVGERGTGYGVGLLLETFVNGTYPQ
eukprot:m.69865 g.69865  ORF g.69865 m.69865 type:complete len:541 (+) comp8612_c0_seq1:42-1664(+)